jgi:glycosyltransferase involved in cell wall biosynthesis
VILSVVIIAHNEAANLGRTLESVQPLVGEGRGEVIVVDSGSTDHTVDIARSYGARVFVEEWKGYAAQKNSAIEKARSQWILSLDADESLDPMLAGEIFAALNVTSPPNGFLIPRKNSFLGRWIKHGGFWPDLKLRLFQRGKGKFGDSLVHETVELDGPALRLKHALVHHSYPTLTDYIDHMNRYSSLGAEMAAARRQRGFSVLDIVIRPLLTFTYNYIFRLGFLDGREGLLLHLYHAVYVSWKYAKAWELGGNQTK